MLNFSGRTTEAPHKSGVVQNRFLATLSPDDFERLRPFLSSVELKRHAVIHEANKLVDAVYFIESGVISRVARTQSDGPVEVAMVGRSGFIGISVIIGTMMALDRTVVQIPGLALRISASDLQRLMASHPPLRDHLLSYVHVLMMQKAQVSFCNAKHDIESRLARWLALAHDRVVGDALPVTHELLALMLGVRRAGVSETIARFEAAGIVRRGRATLKIEDRELLLGKTCECYRIISDRSFWRKSMPLHQHRLR